MQGMKLRRIPEGKPGAGIAVAWLHYSANPEMTPEVIAKLRASTPTQAIWDREMEINYEAMEGTPLYPGFSRALHVVPAYDVSDRARWTIWQGADPHTRTPHAFVWEAFGDRGDRVICGELWPNDGIAYTTREYAEAIELLESDSFEKPPAFRWCAGKKLEVYDRYMDTHGAAVNSDEGEDYFKTYANYGLDFKHAHKGEQILSVAVDSIREAMKNKRLDGSDKIPVLHVFEDCVETVNEFELVRFPKGDAEKAADERPMTYRKHCLDCAAYIESALPGYVLPSVLRPQDEFNPIYPHTGY
jgi:hypothetical protein